VPYDLLQSMLYQKSFEKYETSASAFRQTEGTKSTLAVSDRINVRKQTRKTALDRELTDRVDLDL